MGGGSNAKDNVSSNAAWESQLAKTLTDQGQASIDKMNTLQAPAIAQLTKIVSGDKNALTSATSQPIGQLAKSAQASKENIYDQIPAGAGRDVALAQNTMNKNSGVASFLNDTYMKAFPALANMGTAAGNVGLQETGGGLNAMSGSTNAYGQVMQADAQGKASTMNLFGSLAGAGGMAMGGSLGKKLFG